jgi:predicted transcriptional regulator
MDQSQQLISLPDSPPPDFMADHIDHPENTPKGLQTEEIVRLKESGLSATKIAKYLKISKASVFYHLSKAGTHFGKPTSYFQENKDNILESIQEKIISLGFEDSKIKKACLRDTAIALGTIEDKIRLIRGMSTHNVGISGMINHLIEDRTSFRAALEGAASSRRNRVFDRLSPTDLDNPTDKAVGDNPTV